ncbi:hypothetical protein EUTSA_v10000321mg [Eutrema salsugineum]|uniref:Phytocyanin domain-containing protein n=1 Tax=Eutrema salsugineum TaxID=72664 RepID=V4M299_EUTSA|nr:early nodulin-like protein 1 [Eutrema salsugineum]ESQ46348.1 hypothetical protein EUTSA_v10000321mg [Eutrema salsugineum]
MASLITTLPLVFLLFTTFYHLGESRTFIVGGDLGWKVPALTPNNSNSLIDWANHGRFLVGDVLEFKYDSNVDSVLEVTKEHFETCNAEKPLKSYKHVNTIVKLDNSGPNYFISGVHDNCVKGEKVIVRVIASKYAPRPAPPTTTPAAPATPSSKPPTSPATPETPSSKPPTPPAAPVAPAPGPSNNTAGGLVAGSGIFWAFVALIGLALV